MSLQTIYFQVLDKSPVSGPGRSPPSCNKSSEIPPFSAPLQNLNFCSFHSLCNNICLFYLEVTFLSVPGILSTLDSSRIVSPFFPFSVASLVFLPISYFILSINLLSLQDSVYSFSYHPVSLPLANILFRKVTSLIIFIS